MKVKIKKDDEGYYIAAEDILPYYDLDLVESYTLDAVDGHMELKVYDKDGNIIPPSQKKVDD